MKTEELNKVIALISSHKEIGTSKLKIKWRVKLGYPEISEKEFNDCHKKAKP